MRNFWNKKIVIHVEGWEVEELRGWEDPSLWLSFAPFFIFVFCCEIFNWRQWILIPDTAVVCARCRLYICVFMVFGFEILTRTKEFTRLWNTQTSRSKPTKFYVYEKPKRREANVVESLKRPVPHFSRDELLNRRAKPKTVFSSHSETPIF